MTFNDVRSTNIRDNPLNPRSSASYSYSFPLSRSGGSLTRGYRFPLSAF
jgi:hypothetical protein